MLVNVRGEIVLTSTSSTVFREESDESDISMELSQKQRDDNYVNYSKIIAGSKSLNKIKIDVALQNLNKEEEANKQLPYIIQTDKLNEPPLLASTKQIWSEAQKILQEWAAVEPLNEG